MRKSFLRGPGLESIQFDQHLPKSDQNRKSSNLPTFKIAPILNEGIDPPMAKYQKSYISASTAQDNSLITVTCPELNEIITNDKEKIDQNNLDKDNNIKVSHGKKNHVILKII